MAFSDWLSDKNGVELRSESSAQIFKFYGNWSIKKRKLATLKIRMLSKTRTGR